MIWFGLECILLRVGLGFVCTCKAWYLMGSYLCVCLGLVWFGLVGFGWVGLGLVGLGWGSRSVGIMFHEELKIVGSRLVWASFTDTELTNDILNSEEKT